MCFNTTESGEIGISKCKWPSKISEGSDLCASWFSFRLWSAAVPSKRHRKQPNWYSLWVWGGARHQTYIYLWVCSCVQAHTDILCRVVSRWWAWTALSALPPPHPSSLPLSPIIAGLIHPARFGNRLIRVISHNKQWPTQTAQRWLCSPQNIRTQKWALNTFHHQWWNIDISSFLLKKFIPVPQIFFPYSQRREREAQHVFHTGQSYFSQTKASFLLVSECVLWLNFPVIAVKFMGTALVSFSSLPAGKQGRCLAVGAGVRGNVFVLFCVMINPSAVPRISAG